MNLYDLGTDILPQIAYYTIDFGVDFKNFRMVSRLFLKIADRLRWRDIVKSNQKSGSSSEIFNMLPGDLYFADHKQTIMRRHNMVPLITDLPLKYFSKLKLTEHVTSSFILKFHPPNFDYFVAITKMGGTSLANIDQNTDLQKIADELQDDAQMVALQKMRYKTMFEYVESAWSFLILFFRATVFRSGDSKLVDSILRYSSLMSSHLRSQMAPLDVIKGDPKYPWNYKFMSANPYITKEFYLEKIDEEWCLNSLCINPAMDFEFARQLSVSDGVDPRSEARVFTIHYLTTVSTLTGMDIWTYKMPAFYRVDVPWEYLVEHMPAWLSVCSDGYRVICVPYCARGNPERWKQLIDMLHTDKIQRELLESIFANHDVTWKTFDPDIHYLDKINPKNSSVWVA